MLILLYHSGEHRARPGGALSDLPHSLSEDKRTAYSEESRHTHTPAVSPTPLLPLERVGVTIHTLPDDILLEIFDFCREDNEYFTPRVWKPLVQVCQRWRHIIFAYPRRLHLLLVCNVRTPVKKLLDIWPSLPIAIHYSPREKEGEENVIAALKHHQRISWIVFDKLTNPVLEKLAAVMKKPLPALTGLHLQSLDEIGLVISNAFLGGSAPRLQVFFLEGIAFPALHKVIVNANQLTKLWLQRIPDAGYIDPEVMGACLTALPKLEELYIGFQSPPSRPLQLHPHPPTRTALRALTYVGFRGDSTYLEELIARISAPNLDSLNVWFFMDLGFAIPQLYNFITSSERLKFLKRAYMELYPWSARITLGSSTSLDLGTSCDELEQRVLWMAQLCSELSDILSHVECLEIKGDADSQVELPDGMESLQWLEVFRPFIGVQGLYVSKKMGSLVTHSLQEFTQENATEVLPLLRSLSLGGLRPCGSVEDAIKPFVTARQLSNRPVVVENWEQDLYQDSEDDY